MNPDFLSSVLGFIKVMDAQPFFCVFLWNYKATECVSQFNSRGEKNAFVVFYLPDLHYGWERHRPQLAIYLHLLMIPNHLTVYSSCQPLLLLFLAKSKPKPCRRALRKKKGMNPQNRVHLKINQVVTSATSSQHRSPSPVHRLPPSADVATSPRMIGATEPCKR